MVLKPSSNTCLTSVDCKSSTMTSNLQEVCKHDENIWKKTKGGYSHCRHRCSSTELTDRMEVRKLDVSHHPESKGDNISDTRKDKHDRTEVEQMPDTTLSVCYLVYRIISVLRHVTSHIVRTKKCQKDKVENNVLIVIHCQVLEYKSKCVVEKGAFGGWIVVSSLSFLNSSHYRQLLDWLISKILSANLDVMMSDDKIV